MLRYLWRLRPVVEGTADPMCKKSHSHRGFIPRVTLAAMRQCPAECTTTRPQWWCPPAGRECLCSAGVQRSCAFPQIIVFLCYGARLNKWVLQTYHPEYMKSPLVYHPGHRARAWRFLTYMFMHVG